MIGFVVDSSVVRRIKRAKFSMLDYWPHVCFPEISAEFVPVVSFFGGEGFDAVEISFEDLPADLRIVRMFHRTVYI